MAMASHRTISEPRECIFCNIRRTLTREHIWPAWVRGLIPREPIPPKGRADHKTTFETAPGLGRFDQGKLARAGELGDQKLKVVCKPCNNEWMSQLQEVAKPILTPRITGDWSATLSRDEQKILASWATMFTMVLEFAHPKTISISQAARSHFRLTREHDPLPNSLIFMGRSSGTRMKFIHQGIGTVKPVPGKVPLCDTLFAIFTVGDIIFQIMSSQASSFEAFAKTSTEYARAGGLSQIWPILADDAPAPTHIYGNEEFVRLAVVISDRLFSR
jgi:hypothetical protein